MGRPLHSTQQQSVRPFIPAGRTSPDVLLRGQVQDLLSALEAGLSSDWPRSFIKVCGHSSCVTSIEHVGCSRVRLIQAEDQPIMTTPEACTSGCVSACEADAGVLSWGQQQLPRVAAWPDAVCN